MLARLRSWLYSSVHRADLDRSIGDELQFHMDRYAEDLVRAGVPPLEARRRARAEFGSVHARSEECREALGLRLLDELRADLRYAVRLLRRSPAFTVVAVLSLGLGIGANTAIFSLIDTVLLKSLRVARPDGLFFVDNSGGKSGGRSGPPYPCYEILRDHTRYFSGLAAFNGRRFKVTIDGAQEEIRGQFASGSYFDVLGVHAAHGRVLTPADDRNIGRSGGDGYVAVISHALWARRFGMSPSVLGKTIQVGTKWVTIVGVTPPEFIGLQVGFPIDVTIPITLADGTSVATVVVAQRRRTSSGRRDRRAGARGPRRDVPGVHDRQRPEHRGRGVLQPHRARARGQGTERYPPAAGAAAAGHHGDRRHRAPDRLRQRREPAARAWERAAK